MMNDADKKTLGHLYFWGAPIGGFLLWPALSVSTGRFHGTIFNINYSDVHAHIYMGLVFVIFVGLLFLMISGLLILNRLSKHVLVFQAIAVLVFIGNVSAALFSFWLVSCMGYGQSCI